MILHIIIICKTRTKIPLHKKLNIVHFNFVFFYVGILIKLQFYSPNIVTVFL